MRIGLELLEAAGSAIDSFVKAGDRLARKPKGAKAVFISVHPLFGKETDRKHAGEELIRSPRPSELKASARTVRTLQETACC